MSDMREAFEAAYEATHKSIISRPYPHCADGYYYYHEIDQGWNLWQAAQSVPGFVLVPVESAKFCATIAKLHFDMVRRHFAADYKFQLSEKLATTHQRTARRGGTGEEECLTI